MIDELLNTFRSEVAEPDRETAERIFALATRSATRRRHTTLGFRPRRIQPIPVAEGDRERLGRELVCRPCADPPG